MGFAFSLQLVVHGTKKATKSTKQPGVTGVHDAIRLTSSRFGRGRRTENFKYL